MTLAEKNQGFFQKHHKILAALLAIALPYAGFNGYQDVQEYYAPAPGAGDQTVTVNVASMPEGATAFEIDKAIAATVKAAMDAHQGSRQYHEFQQ